MGTAPAEARNPPPGSTQFQAFGSSSGRNAVLPGLQAGANQPLQAVMRCAEARAKPPRGAAVAASCRRSHPP
jgi:hypothetical protein